MYEKKNARMARPNRAMTKNKNRRNETVRRMRLLKFMWDDATSGIIRPL
jgi:hypothetical protein